MDLTSNIKTCCSFLLCLPPSTPCFWLLLSGFFHGSVQEFLSLFSSQMTNFLVQILVTVVTMTPMPSFVLLRIFLCSTVGFFFCCCLDPLSSTTSLGSAASRWSARLCCFFPHYALDKTGSCLLESQGASYSLSDCNFLPGEVRGCCSCWELWSWWNPGDQVLCFNLRTSDFPFTEFYWILNLPLCQLWQPSYEFPSGVAHPFLRPEDS